MQDFTWPAPNQLRDGCCASSGGGVPRRGRLCFGLALRFFECNSRKILARPPKGGQVPLRGPGVGGGHPRPQGSGGGEQAPLGGTPASRAPEFGFLAQLVRASSLHLECQRFKSVRTHVPCSPAGPPPGAPGMGGPPGRFGTDLEAPRARASARDGAPPPRARPPDRPRGAGAPTRALAQAGATAWGRSAAPTRNAPQRSAHPPPLPRGGARRSAPTHAPEVRDGRRGRQARGRPAAPRRVARWFKSTKKSMAT